MTRPRRVARIRGTLATALAVLVLAMTAGSVWLLAAGFGDGVPFDSTVGQVLAEITLGTGYAVVGWIVAARRGDNPLGWIYLVIGVSQVGEAFVDLAALRGLVLAPGSVPFADVLAWAGSFVWAPGLGLFLTFALLLFPTGTLPSRRWRPVAWVAVPAIVLLAAPTAIAAWPYRGAALLSPDGPTPPDWVTNLTLVGLLTVVGVAIAGVASIVVRWRRASGRERRQLKWFVWAVGPVVAAPILSAFVPFSPPVWVGVALLSPVLPLAIGFAILRYRLYEIDRIVSRTISWAAVTGVLAAVFGAGVVALQGVLHGLTQGDTLAVAASTLVAFAFFQPLRRRVQAAVDRRFDRARVDAAALVGDFTEDLRGSVALGAVAGALEGATGILRPAHVGLWLRPAEGDRADGGS